MSRDMRDTCRETSQRGGWGIRTPEGLHPTRFPSVRHRPLGESSSRSRRPSSLAHARRTWRIPPMRREARFAPRPDYRSVSFFTGRSAPRPPPNTGTLNHRLQPPPSPNIHAEPVNDFRPWQGRKKHTRHRELRDAQSGTDHTEALGHPGVDEEPPAANWPLPRDWRKLKADSPRGVIPQNSPRAGRQQGQVSSDGCVGGLFMSGDARVVAVGGHG